MTDVTESGVPTTASNLLFTGSRDRTFYALDAATGEILWNANLGSQVVAGPASYSVDGQQYVVIAAGSTLFSFALPE